MQPVRLQCSAGSLTSKSVTDSRVRIFSVVRSGMCKATASHEVNHNDHPQAFKCYILAGTYKKVSMNLFRSPGFSLFIKKN
jgi:hypothetical protein